VKLFYLLLPLAVVMLGIAALRYQYFTVVDKATAPSDGASPAFRVVTPALAITPLCGTSGRGCTFPGLTYGTPTPKKGLPLY
jgi:hypothetical protein